MIGSDELAIGSHHLYQVIMSLEKSKDLQSISNPFVEQRLCWKESLY